MELSATQISAGLIGFGLVIASVMFFFGRPRPKTKRKPAKKKEETLKELKSLAKTTVEAPLPIDVPDKNQITSGGEIFHALEELEIGGTIIGELTRIFIKGDTRKRIVIKRLNIKIKPGLTNKDVFVFTFGQMTYSIKPNKILEFTNKKGKKVFKLIFDIMYSEPLNPDGSITWDQEVEDISTDSGMDQLIKSAETESQFEFTRTVMIGMIIAAIFLIPTGMALQASGHFIPVTIVHWATTK